MTQSRRLELYIDVFEKQKQKALALPTLTAPELVEAILHEFRELEYLTQDPDHYHLNIEGQGMLSDERPLGELVSHGATLKLVEPDMALPRGTKQLSQPAYLRDMAESVVYRLAWQPSVIGRPDQSQGNDEWIAVDLQNHKSGLRVSRRHARIIEANGTFMIEGMSKNPTSVRHENGGETPVGSRPVPLASGDVIYLERAGISLKFLTRG